MNFYFFPKGFQVVGIVVCNTQDTKNKATFPHINLAVPAPTIARIMEEYIISGGNGSAIHMHKCV